jgi:hypothetical protein
MVSAERTVPSAEASALSCVRRLSLYTWPGAAGSCVPPRPCEAPSDCEAPAGSTCDRRSDAGSTLGASVRCGERASTRGDCRSIQRRSFTRSPSCSPASVRVVISSARSPSTSTPKSAASSPSWPNRISWASCEFFNSKASKVKDPNGGSSGSTAAALLVTLCDRAHSRHNIAIVSVERIEHTARSVALIGSTYARDPARAARGRLSLRARIHVSLVA